MTVCQEKKRGRNIRDALRNATFYPHKKKHREKVEKDFGNGWILNIYHYKHVYLNPSVPAYGIILCDLGSKHCNIHHSITLSEKISFDCLTVSLNSSNLTGRKVFENKSKRMKCENGPSL